MVIVSGTSRPRRVKHQKQTEPRQPTGAGGRVIEAAIALRYPEDISEAHDLHAALSSALLSYCVFTESTEDVHRFPESGWLDGSVEDLADMVRLVSVPQRAVDRASTALQEGIDGAARLLDELDQTRSGITADIARLLGMSNVPQTRRMACAIIANALVFHERIAGMHPEVKSLARVSGDGVDNPQREVLAAWEAILDINYWAIFAIAKDILEQLPSDVAADILRRLRDTAQSVHATGVDNAHDLTGRIFQRLIADRKYLATFYTRPASAALLARLAVAKMEGVDWSDAEAIGRLRIGDFACGTGALLSAVYEQIAARHERAGGDAAALHRMMMEEVLYGCDVMPSAVHITGSTLSGKVAYHLGDVGEILKEALRRHILTDELLQMPVRLERIETDVSTLKENLTTLTNTVNRIGGDVSMLKGSDYESHVARLANRFLPRQLGVAATIFSSQRNRAALATLLDDAETQGNIDADETDELDKTDLILTADGPTDYILAETSITIKQHDVDLAAQRAALLAKATGQTVTPFAIGAQEEPGINHRDVQVILIPEPTDDRTQADPSDRQRAAAVARPNPPVPHQGHDRTG